MARYGSDIAAELLGGLGIEHIALNPGASLTGLHDSLVNHGEAKVPSLITCCHEAIAVAVAHGYANAARRPMAAMVHDIVGLLNSSISIFNAWMDQAPVIVIGGTGPMACEKRRPQIDWMHTALVQGTAVREFVKWDDQPASLSSLVHSFLRAYRVTMTEPKGPAYVCLDLGLQDEVTEQPPAMPNVADYAPPSGPHADPAALRKVAELLVNARRPVLTADYAGRNPQAVRYLVELAELLGMPVIDYSSRLNIPGDHPLDLTDLKDDLLGEADVVLALDCHLDRIFTDVDNASHSRSRRVRDDAKVVHISLGDLTLKSWCQHVGMLQPVQFPILADSSLVLPALTSLCRELITPEMQASFRARAAEMEGRHTASRQHWSREAARLSDARPISSAFLAAALWEQVKDCDWVLGQSGRRNTRDWIRRSWRGMTPDRYPGGDNGGGGIGYGVGYCIGVALANAGRGRLCIDIQPDGDLLYTPSALWTLAHHPLPVLVVMFNNRSYYNSEQHQARTASFRGRPADNRGAATRLDQPPVDFAAMARSFGLYAEGPIDVPDKLGPALQRAVRYVAGRQVGALIDVITQPK